MKKFLFVSFLLLAGFFAFAGGSITRDSGVCAGGHFGRWFMDPMGMPFLYPEIEKMLRSQRKKPLGSLRVSDIQKLIARMEQIMIINRYIEHSGRASFILPGTGQFINKEPLSGSLFLTAHLGVIGGTLAGAYFLLPQDLQFGSTDYLNESLTAINDRWNSHSFKDYLPSVSVLVGGSIVDMILRTIASRNAEKLAREKIQSGAVTPRLYFRREKNGFGLGMHMGMM